MLQHTPSPIARAIDLGYGYVKFSTGQARLQEGKLQLPCLSFPSLPVPTPSAATESTDLDVLDVLGLPIEVDGQHYRIFKTPETNAAPFHVRGGGTNYIGSNFYRVCMGAAVKLMQLPTPRIAHLVLGTPVSNFEAGKKAILQNFSGGIAFDGKTVQIDHIHVLRQPLGGLIYHYRRSGREAEVARFNRLIVDPGYGTLDWVVARGLHVNALRSGSTPFGVARIIYAIYENMLQGHGSISPNVSVLEEIDRLVYGAHEFMCFDGQQLKLAHFETLINNTITQGLTEMFRSVGDMTDLHSIVVVRAD